MTYEERLDKIIEQNAKLIAQNEATRESTAKHDALYAEECVRAEAHREYVRRESTTLRDDFAKAALTGLLARHIAIPGADANECNAWIAEYSYAVADAMLRERAK